MNKPHDKQFNTTIARIRVNIEHCIAQLKTWRSLSHGYRGPLNKLPGIIQIVTHWSAMGFVDTTEKWDF